MTPNLLIFIGVILNACLLIYISDLFIAAKVKGKTQTDHPPQALYFLKAGSFIVAGIIVHETLAPLQSLARVLPATYKGNDLVLHTVMYFSLFLAITTIVTFGLFWLSTVLGGMIIKGRNFYIEACNDHLGTTILFAAIQISLAISVAGGLSSIMDSLLPYPSTPVFR